jgi:hypothetical protein
MLIRQHGLDLSALEQGQEVGFYVHPATMT